MQEKDLFEYAVIRIVPRVEREEFVNAGVILYCPKQKFLGVRYQLFREKINMLCPESDMDEIAAHLQAFEQIAKGAKSAGPIAALDLPSRFRWLTATRSTVVQASRVHPGFCDDAADMLNKLFAEQVA